MECKRILIVEDEILIRMYMKKQLQRAGLEVVAETGNGEEAIELAQGLKPDLIFMDIRIHGAYNGVESARKIVANYSIPIAFITAYDMSEEETSGHKLFLGVYNKPLSENSIEEIIRGCQFL